MRSRLAGGAIRSLKARLRSFLVVLSALFVRPPGRAFGSLLMWDLPSVDLSSKPPGIGVPALAMMSTRIWLPCLFAGFIPGIIYCFILMKRMGTYHCSERKVLVYLVTALCDGYSLVR